MNQHGLSINEKEYPRPTGTTGGGASRRKPGGLAMKELGRILNFSIAHTLSLAFAILIVLTMLAGGLAIHRLAAIHATTEAMGNNWLVALRHLADTENLLIDDMRLVNAHVLASESTEKADLEAQIAKVRGQFSSSWDKYLPTVLLTVDKQLVAYEQGLDRIFQTAYQGYLSEVSVVLDLSRSSREAEARALLQSNVGPALVEARKAMRDIVVFNQNSADATVVEAAELFNSGWKILVATMLATVAFAVAIVALVKYFWVQPILRLTGSVGALADGSSAVEVTDSERGDEIGQMAQALIALKKTVSLQERTGWLKSSSVKLTAAVQGHDSIEKLAQRLMATLTPLLGAQIGVFYFRDPTTQQYALMGSYGYRARKGAPKRFRLGEGIIGQCALERAPIGLSDISDDFIRIATGLGDAPPSYLFAAPLISSTDGEVLAVIELATMGRFGDREHALLDEVLPLIALSIDIFIRSQGSFERLAVSQSGDPDELRGEI